MFSGCQNLQNITFEGPIHNGIDLSGTGIFNDYANVLNALDTPYNGSQTLKINGSNFGMFLSDYNEYYEVLAEKQGMGWTVAS